MLATEKIISRILQVALNGGNLLVKAGSTLLFSWLVLHYGSAKVWGEFTGLWVILTLLTAVSSFGNKEFTLREMSKFPADHKAIWNRSFYSRMLILLFLLPILFWYFRNNGVFALAVAWFLLFFLQQSFESIVLFQKRFAFPFLVELFGALATCLVLISFLHELNASRILFAYLIGQAVKTGSTLIYYHNHLDTPGKNYFSYQRLSELLPFFLLGFGGFLIDKSDLLSVNFYLSDADKAAYQILSNLCTMGLVAASLTVAPFSKNIYRMQAESLRKFIRNFALFGLFFSLFWILLVSLVMHYFYQLEFATAIYFWFFLNTVAYTFFLPNMYLLTKDNKQLKALRMILISGACTLLLAFVLVRIWGISGAASACALGQILLALLSYYSVKAEPMVVKQA